MAPKKKEAAAPVYDGPMDGQGKFFYGNGATYEGCWKVVLPEDAVAPADGSPFIPAKVRHGMGTYTDGTITSSTCPWKPRARHLSKWCRALPCRDTARGRP